MKIATKKKLKKLIHFAEIYSICTVVCFILDHFKINNLNFIMIYILGVLFIAIISDGYIASLLFSLICVASYNYFFTSPRLSLAVFDLKYIVTFILMFAISIMVCRLTYNLKKKLTEINILNLEKSNIQNEKEKEKLKTMMLRSISHDLRTPLTSIGTGAELLLTNKELKLEERECILKNIYDSSSWTVRLVEDLLLMTKVESNNLVVKKEIEAIEEVIPQAIRNIANIKGNREISVEIPKDLMLVPMDATLIIQLISNILTNAIKFTKDNGKIKIQVFNAGNNAIFRIYNNGKQLEKDSIEKIFDLYYTAPDCKSSGIGLAVCKAIVDVHGGKISVRNTDDGVVFEFSLSNEAEQEIMNTD